MKNSIKLIIAIASFIILFVSAVTYLPKGNDFVKYENDMKKIEQFNK